MVDHYEYDYLEMPLAPLDKLENYISKRKPCNVPLACNLGHDNQVSTLGWARKRRQMTTQLTERMRTISQQFKDVLKAIWKAPWHPH